MEIERKENESYLAFAERVYHALNDGLITYEEWSEALFGEQIYTTENLRRCSVFFKHFIDRIREDGPVDEISVDKLTDLKIAQEELIKERKKLQTVNSEAQEYYRTLARNELFNEKIIEAINNLPPLNLSSYSNFKTNNSFTGLLCVSDLHAGSTYEIRGLYDEIINKYDFDIMTNRMMRLVSDMIADDVEEKCDDLVIGILGDVFENILRTSSLTKLKEPVVDTVIKTSEFLCEWITEIYNRSQKPIKVITVGGNHDTVSFLNSKPRLEEENLTKIVVKFMQERFKNVEEIEVLPFTDAAFANIRGTTVMFEHGEGDLQQTVEFYSNLYGMEVDEIYSGHLHRPESKAIGVSDTGDRMIYRVGSICGIDTYAKKLRKSARPSAYFALYNEDGHNWSKNYYLR